MVTETDNGRRRDKKRKTRGIGFFFLLGLTIRLSNWDSNHEFGDRFFES